MITWVLDLDGVVQEPAYPHPALISDISDVIGVSYEALFRHYSEEFVGNQAEEEYHLSLCSDKEQRQKTLVLWQKLHDSMPVVRLLPGARELLELISGRGDTIFAWTKGSVDIQRKRLKGISLSQFFPEGAIIYSPQKGTRTGIENELIPRLPTGKVIFVDDSFNQGILPALGFLQFFCVWVSSSESYAHRQKAQIREGAYSNLLVVKTVQELIRLVKEGKI